MQAPTIFICECKMVSSACGFSLSASASVDVRKAHLPQVVRLVDSASGDKRLGMGAPFLVSGFHLA